MTAGNSVFKKGDQINKPVKKQNNTAAIIGFLAPAMIVYFVFVVFSIGVTFYYSLFQWSGISADRLFIFFDNYAVLFSDGVFWRSMSNNFLLVAGSLIIQLPVGLLMAVLLFSPIRGIKLFRTVYFMPFLMSTVAIGILFIFIYDGNIGLVNEFLGLIGLENLQRSWLGSSDTAIWAIIATVSWQFAPFYMILFRAGMVGISEDLYEAADVDGASPLRKFFSITLPLLKPTIITASILSIIGSLKYFDLIYIMTGGGPNRSTELMATYMYEQSFTNFNMGYGSSISFSMFVISFIVILIFISITNLNKRGEQ